MSSTREPRNIAKEQYAAMRQSLVATEERVAGRWDKNAPVRTSFQRFLGSLDRVAGWLFDDRDQNPRRVLPLEIQAPGTVEVTFTLPAEVEAGRVAVCGEFNDWSTDDIELARDADRTWRATVSLEPGRGYRYRYLLDGERWENAWQADGYVPNPYGGVDSVINVGSGPSQ